MDDKGSLRVIYSDYQQNKDPLGVAVPIRYVKSGYPFILEEEKDTVQVTYICDYYEIRWVHIKDPGKVNPERKIYPIRRVFFEGLTPSSIAENYVVYEPDDSSNLLKDKFIIIHGIEVF